MYSWEIEDLIKYRNYLLKAKEYLKILSTSPQINRVKYNPFEDKFEIWTDDNFYWKFDIEKRNNNEEENNQQNKKVK